MEKSVFDIQNPLFNITFSSLPTGGVRIDSIVARRGLYALHKPAMARNPFLPFPREGIAQAQALMT